VPLEGAANSAENGELLGLGRGREPEVEPAGLSEVASIADPNHARAQGIGASCWVDAEQLLHVIVRGTAAGSGAAAAQADHPSAEAVRRAWGYGDLLVHRSVEWFAGFRRCLEIFGAEQQGILAFKTLDPLVAITATAPPDADTVQLGFCKTGAPARLAKGMAPPGPASARTAP
jgi:hypothetical protein